MRLDRTLIDYFWNRGRYIFDHATAPDSYGMRHINAVIAGDSDKSWRMLRTLAWFCQMDGWHVSIDMYSGNAEADRTFMGECPELMDSRHNCVSVPGDAEYCITLHDGSADGFLKAEAPTFVFIGYGSDEENAIHAGKAASAFPTADIVTFLRSESRSGEMASGIDLLDMESDNEITEAEGKALRRHLRHGSPDTFWSNEYACRSSIASTLHTKLRHDLDLPGMNTPIEERSREVLERLACIEHRRWCAYLRTEGWCWSGSRDPSSRNNGKKLHHNLVPYDELTEKDRRKDDI